MYNPTILLSKTHHATFIFDITNRQNIFCNVIKDIENVMDELYLSIVGEGNVPFDMAWVYPLVNLTIVGFTFVLTY